MNALLETLPLKKDNATSTNCDATLTMDQWYGKIKNIEVADSFGYGVYSFAASQGSHYPFICLSELEEKKKEWNKKVGQNNVVLLSFRE